MSEHFLYETLDILRDAKVNLDLPEIIETGLSKNIILREYQIALDKDEIFKMYSTKLIEKNELIEKINKNKCKIEKQE